MAIHAAHVTFNDRMVLGQIEFRLHVKDDIGNRTPVFPGINNKAGQAAGTDMLAAGTMAGLATALAGHRCLFNMQARLGTGREFLDNFRMAIRACLVAGIMRAGNFERGDHRRRARGAGKSKK